MESGLSARRSVVILTESTARKHLMMSRRFGRGGGSNNYLIVIHNQECGMERLKLQRGKRSNVSFICRK